MKNNLKFIFIALFFLFLTYICIQMFIPTNIGNMQLEIEIPEGSTYKQAVNILADNGLLRDRDLFLLIGRLYGIDRKIRAGYYVFYGSMSPWQVFKELAIGRIIENEITIVEGDSLFEIGRKLDSNKIMPRDVFNMLVNDRAFLNSLNINAPSLEGYLFPETYKFAKGTKPEAVLKLMVDKLRESFTEELRLRSKEIGLSENEVLALASIIEKEASVDEERTLISAVFHNRLKRRMPLQADPTAIYGVKNYGEKVTKRDLKNRTKYNTYLINRLPPGPIASPGIKSIKAALYPADVPYLYFVSNLDGTHSFSSTLSEHNDAVKRLRAVQEAILNQKEMGKADEQKEG